jgi:hypothetical protein
MHVPVNMLLRTEDARLAPATAKAIFAALRNAKPDIVAKAKRELIAPADIVRNARLTDDQTLRMIYDRYGEAGLFDLFVLTGGERSRHFEWVLTRIAQKSIFIGSDKLQDDVLQPDDDPRIRENKAKVARYNTNRRSSATACRRRSFR